MPYSETSDLPKNIKNNLPDAAQEIYKEAYNSAWEQYKDSENRRKDSSREETAHKVAWAAVKNKYKKDENQGWIKKD